jgi:formamidopyrimidine-DNA glycosylase
VPELPEVETVRRMLAEHVVGRTIESIATSGQRLRQPLPRALARRVLGRSIRDVGRRGKYILLHLDQGLTLLSHLGMSGRWLFHRSEPTERPAHVHFRVHFSDGTRLWFQDARRFGLLELHETARLAEAPSLAGLGPEPYPDPPPAETLRDEARGLKAAVKLFLMDQRRLAGIGNIYASEILFRAAVHPARPAGRIALDEWERIRGATGAVLGEAVDRFGTTFSLYRTLWNGRGIRAVSAEVPSAAGPWASAPRTSAPPASRRDPRPGAGAGARGPSQHVFPQWIRSSEVAAPRHPKAAARDFSGPLAFGIAPRPAAA